MVDGVASDPVLVVDRLRVEFPGGWRRSPVVAVDDVSLEVGKGETLGLVGESGSGKSTTAQAIMGLLPPAGGKIKILGNDVGGLSREEMRRLRSQIQMVMQNPYSSLNPRMRIGSLVREPLKLFEAVAPQSMDKRVSELLQMVGLPAEYARRYPFQLSGGERQRVNIARALAPDPEILVCDEALSALDMSIQAEILALLGRLQSELGIAMVFISHDLQVVRNLCHSTVVLRNGRVVESGPTVDLFANPQEEYTKTLLEAAPVPDPMIERTRRGRPIDPDAFPSDHYVAPV